MESYMSYISFAGSAITMLTTLYFWLVRVRREQPQIKPYLADREFFLGVCREGARQIGVKVGVIAANYSILPNAILGARLWIRLRDGWQSVDHVAFDKQTPQPFNLSPMQTVLLRLGGTLTLPYQDDLEQGSKTMSNYMDRFIAQPLEMKLELRHLHDRADVHRLTLQSGQEGSAQGTRSLSAAA
jgi:hypothetical protein